MRALQSKHRLFTQPFLGLACACLLAAQAAVQAQPHAVEPLPSPLFAIDHETPLSAALPAASVLSKPGPSLAIDYPGLGLTNADDLNGLSFNRSLNIGPLATFVLLFGVDRETGGGVPPDPAFLAANRPFNVQDQANRNQAAGDLYVTLDIFSFAGVIETAGPRSIAANNTLAINQGDTGGVDQDLSPELAPSVREEGTMPDNANAVAYEPLARTGVVFFSITRDSPSFSGSANVYIDLEPQIPGQEFVFAGAEELGLQGQLPGPSDDIDALVVFDVNANNMFDVGLDAIFFSLDRASPTLIQRGASPADVFISRGGGVCEVYAEAMLLGLDPAADNVDCLEVYPSSPLTRLNDIMNWSIFRVWPGDFDNNGTLDHADTDMFPTCFSGTGNVVAGTCTVFDIDYDYDVDCKDLAYLRSVYTEASLGGSFVLLAPPDFVAVLLGTAPTLPEMECFADMNDDGRVDGLDIPLFVEAVQTP